MKVFKVYFEIYGKKMKVEVMSKNIEYAKSHVRDQIIIHKVIDVTPKDGDDFITNFFNTLKK